MNCISSVGVSASVLGRSRSLLVAGTLFAAMTLLSAGCTTDPAVEAPTGWETTLSDLPTALTSVVPFDDVHGLGVLTVGGGGQVQLGSGDVADTWAILDPGTTEDLWWVTDPGGPSLWIAGAKGTVLQYDKATQAFTDRSFASDHTLYGIWGTSDDQLWTVGGWPGHQDEGGLLKSWDGTAWSDVADLPAGALDDTLLFKVWGRSATDVWVVGAEGRCLHLSGGTWEIVDTGNQDTLFTISGNADRVVAVGGVNQGMVLEWTDATGTFTDISPDFATPLIGVDARGDEIYAAGQPAELWRRDVLGVWHEEEDAPQLGQLGLHAVYVGPDGEVWGAGGEVVATLTQGLLIHRWP